MDKAGTPARQKPFFRFDPFATVSLTFVIFFFSQIVAVILVGAFIGIRGYSDAESLNWLENSVAGQFAFYLMAETIAITMVLQFLRLAKVVKARIGLIKPKSTDVLQALIAYGLYFLSFIVVTVVASMVFSGLDLEQEQQIGFATAYTNLELMMTFASLVILPPLAEEIIFRGFLFSSLRAKYSFRISVVVTSIMFGLAHLQFGSGAPLLWVAAIDTFVLSCFLCALRERSGSLWPPIFLHAIKNCVAFILLFGQRF